MDKHSEAAASSSSLARGLGRVVSGIDKLLAPINGLVYNVSKIVLFVMMWLITLDVLGRNLINTPVPGTFELVGLMMVIAIFLTFGITETYKEHIEITFLVERWPPKAQAALSAVNYLVSFVFLLILLLQFFYYTERLWKGNNVSTYLHLPIYIFAIIAAIGVIIYALTCLREFFAQLQKVVDRS